MDRDGGAVDNEGNLTVSNVVFRNNAAGDDGGAIGNDTLGTLTVTGSTFVGNRAAGDGGAIDNEGKATVTGSTFTNNTAGRDGGAVNNDLGATLSATGNTVTANTSATGQGAIDNNGGSSSDDGNSFDDNSGRREPGRTELVVTGSGGEVVTFRPDDNPSTSDLVPDDRLTPFPGVAGTPRGAAGDFNGDGVPDRVFVTGPGGGDLVRVIDGATGATAVSGFRAYAGEDFTRIGLFVAAGDVDGDGRDELVVSPDRGGGARVQVFQLAGGALVQRANFFGIDDPNFRGGGRIALGDVNGDGRDDLTVGAGIGGGPRVAVYDGRGLLGGNARPAKLVGDFLAFEPRLRNGVFVASGDVSGDGRADLVFGGGPGGAPRVLALDGLVKLRGDGTIDDEQPLANFFAFDPAQRGGVRVALKDVDGDDSLDLVTASGDDSAPGVRTYSGRDLRGGGEPEARQEFEPFDDSTLRSGVFVG